VVKTEKPEGTKLLKPETAGFLTGKKRGKGRPEQRKPVAVKQFDFRLGRRPRTGRGEASGTEGAGGWIATKAIVGIVCFPT